MGQVSAWDGPWGNLKTPLIFFLKGSKLPKYYGSRERCPPSNVYNNVPIIGKLGRYVIKSIACTLHGQLTRIRNFNLV